MSEENELTDVEQDFFEAIDRNTMAEQAIFDALADITDEQYYTLFAVTVEHTCGTAEVEVYPDRAGTLYRCTSCGMAGIIGG